MSLESPRIEKEIQDDGSFKKSDSPSSSHEGNDAGPPSLTKINPFPVNKKVFVVKNGRKFPVMIRKSNTKLEDRKIVVVKPRDHGAVAEITNSKPLDLLQVLNSQFTNSKEKSEEKNVEKCETFPTVNLNSFLRPTMKAVKRITSSSVGGESSSVEKPDEKSNIGLKKRGRPSKSTKNNDFEYKVNDEEDDEEQLDEVRKKNSKKIKQIPSSSKSSCKCERMITNLMRQMTRISNRLDNCQDMIGNLTTAEIEREKRESKELNSAKSEIARLQSQLIIQRTVNSIK